MQHLALLYCDCLMWRWLFCMLPSLDIWTGALLKERYPIRKCAGVRGCHLPCLSQMNVRWSCIYSWFKSTKECGQFTTLIDSLPRDFWWAYFTNLASLLQNLLPPWGMRYNEFPVQSLWSKCGLQYLLGWYESTCIVWHEDGGRACLSWCQWLRTRRMLLLERDSTSSSASHQEDREFLLLKVPAVLRTSVINDGDEKAEASCTLISSSRGAGWTMALAFNWWQGTHSCLTCLQSLWAPTTQHSSLSLTNMLLTPAWCTYWCKCRISTKLKWHFGSKRGCTAS